MRVFVRQVLTHVCDLGKVINTNSYPPVGETTTMPTRVSSLRVMAGDGLPVEAAARLLSEGTLTMRYRAGVSKDKIWQARAGPEGVHREAAFQD